MQIQRVFQAGNSQVVAIPKALAKELGFRVGHKVVMDKTSDGEGLVITRAEALPEKKKSSRVSAEFDKWLKTVIEEDKEIIDELALR